VWLLGDSWVLVRLDARLRASPDSCPHHSLVWLALDVSLAVFRELSDVGGVRLRPRTGHGCGGTGERSQGVDRFLDASHVPFVQAATFGTDKAADVVTSGVERQGWQVATTFASCNRTLDDPHTATGERDALQPRELLEPGPASCTVSLRPSLTVLRWTTGVLFACRPETPTPRPRAARRPAGAGRHPHRRRGPGGVRRGRRTSRAQHPG
jgi:hypothetical protein